MNITIEHYTSAIRAARPLFRTKIALNNFEAALQNAKSEQSIPVNSELAILSDFLDVLTKRDITFQPKPYWLSEVKYDPIDVFISSIEFFDHHHEPLPRTTIPPEGDINKFVNLVLQSKEKLTVSEQLKNLLDISKGNVLGAANLGFLSSRLLARGLDTRVYPNIQISPQIMLEANKHFAQFESDHTERNDAPGDTYYFWTQFFATSVFYQLGCFQSQALDKLFSIGPPIMRLVRKYIARQPTISEHYEASLLGRDIGIAISELSPQIENKNLY
jgi:hypothetical protein